MIGELFTLLADRRRRRVLVSLLDAGDAPVPVSDVTLTRGAAARSSVASTGDSTAARGRSETVEDGTALRHVHLPKLDESDLVDWDPEAETVARGPRYAEAEAFLELLVRNQHELPGHLV